MYLQTKRVYSTFYCTRRKEKQPRWTSTYRFTVIITYCRGRNCCFRIWTTISHNVKPDLLFLFSTLKKGKSVCFSYIKKPWLSISKNVKTYNRVWQELLFPLEISLWHGSSILRTKRYWQFWACISISLHLKLQVKIIITIIIRL